MTEIIEIHGTFDFENALARAKENPLRAAKELRAAIKQVEKRRRRWIYEQMAIIGAIYQQLQSNDSEMTSFRELRSQIKYPHEPRDYPELAYVVLHVFNGTIEEEYICCIKRTAALHLLIAEGIDPKDMPKELRRRGVEALYEEDKNAKNAKAGKAAEVIGARRSGQAAAAETKSEVQDLDDYLGDWEDTGTEEAPDDEDKPEAEGKHEGEDAKSKEPRSKPAVDRAKKEVRRAAVLVRSALENGAQWVVLEADDDLFKLIMATGHFEKPWLQIENRYKVQGLTRFRVIDFK